MSPSQPSRSSDSPHSWFAHSDARTCTHANHLLSQAWVSSFNSAANDDAGYEVFLDPAPHSAVFGCMCPEQARTAIICKHMFAAAIGLGISVRRCSNQGRNTTPDSRASSVVPVAPASQPDLEATTRARQLMRDEALAEAARLRGLLAGIEAVLDDSAEVDMATVSEATASMQLTRRALELPGRPWVARRRLV